MATTGVRRLVHVQTVLSLGQLEDASRCGGDASGAAQSTSQPAAERPRQATASVDLANKTDELPLQQAVGAAKLPLYQYVAPESCGSDHSGLCPSPSAMSLSTDGCVDDGDEQDTFGCLVPEVFSRQSAWDQLALSGEDYSLATAAMKPFASKPYGSMALLRPAGDSWDLTTPISEGGALLPSPGGSSSSGGGDGGGVVPELRTLRTSLSEDGAIGLSYHRRPAALMSVVDLPSLDAISDGGGEQEAASPMQLSRQTSAAGLSMAAAPHQPTTLDMTLSALWDDCDARGLFRYRVADTHTRVVPGHWGWVAQLNEGRSSKKRPTELRADAVCQPFDAAKFHFGKAFSREALMQFEPLPPAPATVGWAASKDGARLVESAPLSADPTVVAINVSPIDYGHVLLLPRVLAHQPQRLHAQALSTAAAFIREVGNPTFRLGYNSLGAYATINHLHFQGYYLSHTLPCERASTRAVPGFTHPNLRVSTLEDYPVRGWVVERQPYAYGSIGVGEAEADMAAVLATICGALQAADQPFNLLFVDGGSRAFVWPQCYAERQAAGEVSTDMLDTGVNPAVFEVAGHLILKRREDYERAGDAWGARLLAGVSLSEERFAALTATAVMPAAAVRAASSEV